MNALKTVLAAAAVLYVLPAFAAGTITITDPYARFMPGAMAGAAFMVIENGGDTDDRLIDATSGIAQKVELHTHKMSADGMMQMIHVTEGFVIPAHGSHDLKRGGDHIMFMGLNEHPAEGSMVHLTLTFEKAGMVELDIPVDASR
ncbi:MAG: copper chaperone PCu(A)C [Defluviimonas sp.]|uniref:copper chaperone PCu(A)C n=1 Tax=Albidovulum sp. TaxID=1872424 RepID=UPI001DE9E471|nr:copper chaperone PCu(A)C [Paracoccaceae bacterium]MCC0062867.1 copper chaperone PCu(A)C [Defluviimonas sp.]